MSVQALAAAFAFDAPSPTCKLVLLALANYADKDGRCWPSQKTLADDTGLTDRTVRTALQQLRDLGALATEERRRADGSRSSDVITLSLQPETVSGGGEARSGGGETASGHEPSINQEANASSPKTPANGTRLPDEWTPNPDYLAGDFSLSHSQHTEELFKFRDYWRAVPGAKGRKLDWDATWRNWLRRAAEQQPRTVVPLNARPSPPDRKQADREANYARAFAGAQRAAEAWRAERGGG